MQSTHAASRPESFKKVLSYRLNIMLNREIAGIATLNGRPIVRSERISACQTAIWTRTGDKKEPLRRDILMWDQMSNGEPWDDGKMYWTDFVYNKYGPIDYKDTIAMPVTSHYEAFDDTSGVLLTSCLHNTP